MKARSSALCSPKQVGRQLSKGSLLVALFVGLSFSSSSQGAIVCVDIDALPGGDGISWATALQNVQDGIIATASGDEVWVAQGVYRESIAIATGRALYGGFLSGATDFASRDFVAHVTTIDASTADAGGPADHVVVMNGTVGSRLDGFTITGGLADGPGEDRNGGGLFCRNLDTTNTIANCTIMNNRTGDGFLGGTKEEKNGGHGAGVYILCASPTISDCTVETNATGNGANGASANPDGGNGGNGAGIYCASSSLLLADCTVWQNTPGRGGDAWWEEGGYGGQGGSGGGLCSVGSVLSIISSFISENKAGGGGLATSIYDGGGGMGGGMCLSLSSTNLLDSTISGNSAGGHSTEWPGDGGSGGGVYGESTSLVVENCLIVGNAAGHASGWGGVSGYDGGDGGGICLIACTEALITNCTIAGNTAGDGGYTDCPPAGAFSCRLVHLRSLTVRSGPTAQAMVDAVM